MSLRTSRGEGYGDAQQVDVEGHVFHAPSPSGRPRSFPDETLFDVLGLENMAP